MALYKSMLELAFLAALAIIAGCVSQPSDIAETKQLEPVEEGNRHYMRCNEINNYSNEARFEKEKDICLAAQALLEEAARTENATLCGNIPSNVGISYGYGKGGGSHQYNDICFESLALATKNPALCLNVSAPIRTDICFHQLGACANLTMGDKLRCYLGVKWGDRAVVDREGQCLGLPQPIKDECYQQLAFAKENYSICNAKIRGEEWRNRCYHMVLLALHDSQKECLASGHQLECYTGKFAVLENAKYGRQLN